MIGRYVKPFEEVEKQIYEKNPYVKIIGEYKGVNKHCEVQCLKCGNIWSPVLNTLSSGHGCPVCAKTGTSFMENYILTALKFVLGENEVKHRNRTAIGMELDIYLPSYKYAIEPGSWYWHKSKIDRDLQKLDRCRDQGIHLNIIYDCFDESEKPFPDCSVYSENIGNLSDNHLLQGIVANVLIDLGISFVFTEDAIEEISHTAYLLSSRMTTDEFAKEIANVVPNIEVIGTYRGRNHKIRVRCKQCGYEYDAMVTVLLAGHGCRKCGRKIVGEKQSYTHNVFVEKLKQVDPHIVVDGDYIDSKTHIDVHCSVCDYHWSPVPSSLLSGKGCPKCVDKRSAELRSVPYDDFMADFEKNGNSHINIIGKYVSKSHKIEVECDRCGKRWMADGRDLCNGRGCNKCDGHEQLTHDEYVKRLYDVNPNIDVLSQYIKADERIDVCCKICGHKWSPTAISLIQTNPCGCPECSKRRRVKQRSKPVYCVELHTRYDSISDAARSLHLSPATVYKGYTHPDKCVGSYHWKYVDVEE